MRSLTQHENNLDLHLENVSHGGKASNLLDDGALKENATEEKNTQGKFIGVFRDKFTRWKKKTSRIFTNKVAVLGIWATHRKGLPGKVGFSSVCIISLRLCFFPTSQQFQRRSLNMESNALEALKVLGHSWYEK